jgi:N-acetylglucosamine kinase-like BadF-type ATPase
VKELSPRYFLGVDGGGTKTHFGIVDRDGNVLGSHEEPSAYHLQVGFEALREVLARGLGAVLDQAQIAGDDVAHAFFGLPAYGEDSAVQPQLDAMPQSMLGHSRYTCGNDMVCAWAGSLAGADGINIVAGTGSGAYGERRGRTARAGGWGEVFGDEGSAYWIALQGLNAFTRMSDGRLPRGALYGLFRSSFGLTEDLDLCAKVMNAHTRSSIAAIAQLVTEAARAGDGTAVGIFQHAAGELGAIVEALRKSLEFESEEAIPVSYSGGVFQTGDLILGPLRKQLAQFSERFDLRAPLLAPYLGAALHAAKLAGHPLTASAIERLRLGAPAKPRFRP